MNAGLINEQFHDKHCTRGYKNITNWWGSTVTHTHTHRAEVKRDPLTAPKQDSPTKTGISQDITPRWYSPKLCRPEHVSVLAQLMPLPRAGGRTDTHHGDGLGRDHDLRGDGGEVGQVGQDVNHRDDGHGDHDGQGQVPAGEGRGGTDGQA